MTLVLNGTTGVSSVDGSASTPAIQGNDTNTGVFFPAADTVAIATGGSERLRADSSGNVGIGTSSPNRRLHVQNGSSGASNYSVPGLAIESSTNVDLQMMGSTTGQLGITFSDSGNNQAGFIYYQNNGDYMQFATNGSERARIDSSGNLLVAKTTTDFGTAGFNYDASVKQLNLTTDGNSSLRVNRLTSDGNLVSFQRGGSEKGTISVSGETVSYNAFAGSHWSQLSDGSKPEILRGTVMESIDELCQWPDEPTTERLCRVKVSDAASSKKVYGVFMCWDEDWIATNDMLVTSVGAFVCRVNGAVVVQEGDLLESNGDGTARVQADDIMRSSTIGKVTCTIKTHEYADGSYCVPAVLYCG